MSKIFPSIPDPQPTTESLADSVRALKMAVELLTGQRPGAESNRVFVQDATPTALRAGDLWITVSTSLIRYWNGSTWLKLTIT